MIRISTIAPESLTNINDVVDEIVNALGKLHELAKITNFDNPVERENYENNVDYLKQFYERAESLLNDEIAKDK